MQAGDAYDIDFGVCCVFPVCSRPKSLGSIQMQLRIILLLLFSLVYDLFSIYVLSFSSSLSVLLLKFQYHMRWKQRAAECLFPGSTRGNEGLHDIWMHDCTLISVFACYLSLSLSLSLSTFGEERCNVRGICCGRDSIQKYCTKARQNHDDDGCHVFLLL